MAISPPYLEHHCDAYVFTRRHFAPSWVPDDLMQEIAPAIDPIAPSTLLSTQAPWRASSPARDSWPDERARLGSALDGSRGRVERRCDVVRSGPAPLRERPGSRSSHAGMP